MREALLVLTDAVQSLTTGNGQAKESLRKAMVSVCDLKPSQFPTELQPDFLRLRDELCPDWRLAWITDAERHENIRAKVEALKNGDCIRATYAVIKLQTDLAVYLQATT